LGKIVQGGGGGDKGGEEECEGRNDDQTHLPNLQNPSQDPPSPLQQTTSQNGEKEHWSVVQ